MGKIITKRIVTKNGKIIIDKKNKEIVKPYEIICYIVCLSALILWFISLFD